MARQVEPEPADESRSEASNMFPDAGDSIDTATFEQILEMDDDEDRDFSKSIVFDFFTQAESTFDKMDSNLYAAPPPRLKELGPSPAHVAKRTPN